MHRVGDRLPQPPDGNRIPDRIMAKRRDHRRQKHRKGPRLRRGRRHLSILQKMLGSADVQETITVQDAGTK